MLSGAEKLHFEVLVEIRKLSHNRRVQGAQALGQGACGPTLASIPKQGSLGQAPSELSGGTADDS